MTAVFDSLDQDMVVRFLEDEMPAALVLPHYLPAPRRDPARVPLVPKPDPNFNVELLRATLDHIDAHPGLWTQSYWFRRSLIRRRVKACFGGRVSLISGASPDWSRGGGVLSSDIVNFHFRADENGFRSRLAPDYAERQLGVKREHRSLLNQMFRIENSRADLRRLGRELAEAHGHVL